MGCVCSTGKAYNDYLENPKGHKNGKSRKVPKWIAPSSRKSEVEFVPDRVGNDNSANQLGHNNAVFTPISPFDGDSKFLISRQNLQRRITIGSRVSGGQGQLRSDESFIGTPGGERGGQVVTGWPSWLTAVAGEAIVGWVPRKAESFEKLDKIGQGTYSSVYRARDLETGKIVALKKVRFANMDPESVQFMAREIIILRRLDHPNIMKLEGLICSRSSSSLYLVFDYMEHDLAGLASSTGVKLSESQIKCYMQQLLHGLEHCHSHGVLHRDIKCSNLLIDNNGTLKIGDFGLSTFFGSEQKQPLTSRVVTLWYRPPELLLGSTDYGVAVDLWSAGCILAELFAAKPIMSGRTEVEQLHKIFKLCGSPSEGYWKNSKLPNSTIFKPQRPYKRCFKDTYKDFPNSTLRLLDTLLAVEPDRRGTSTLALQSEFFATRPLPCDPSSLPKYPPSKELDVKLREEVNRRKPGGRGLGHESMSKFPKDAKVARAPGANVELAPEKHVGPLQGMTFGSSVRNGPDLRAQRSYMEPTGPQLSRYSNSVAIRGGSRFDSVGDHTNGRHNNFGGNKLPIKREPNEDELHYLSGNDSKSKRIHCSGPLMPPGGNMDEMLKEHEKQIQNAVRRAR